MSVPQEPEAFELDPRARAVRKLRKERDFKRHLTAYVLINGMIVVIWAVIAANGGTWFPWFLFPLLGWGIGLVFHGLDVYGSEISEADVEREMEREQHRRAA